MTEVWIKGDDGRIIPYLVLSGPLDEIQILKDHFDQKGYLYQMIVP
jgi:hypothetical protein